VILDVLLALANSRREETSDPHSESASIAPPAHMFDRERPLITVADSAGERHHRSNIHLSHAMAYVALMMLHACRMLEVTGWFEEAQRRWAAVYLHNLARTHDGVSFRHDSDMMKKSLTMPAARALFPQNGVRESDYPVIHTAVVPHSLTKKLNRTILGGASRRY